MFVSHAPFLHLPYYWDEAGHFVPAARDILRSGAWIPSSTPPNIHPPGVMAYLALAWRLAGYAPETTRIAMLLVGALGVFATFLLADELCGHRGLESSLAALLLFASPLFFAQSMLAQLDAPAMLFTALALWLFLRQRILSSMGVCVLLVLVKETGIVVPLVLGAWLIRERRPREAAWFSLPGVALGLWIAFLTLRTGHWAGSADFASYNVSYLLTPFRLAVSLLRRAYYLLFASGHWIGTAAVLYTLRRNRWLQTRQWRIAAALFAAQVGLVVFLGGASLERYLLPVMPVVYAAMARGVCLLPGAWRAAASALLVASLAAANWINPPYPFPYEDNLAMVDFVDLQREAVHYVAHRYPAARVETIWPLSLELSDPELGFAATPVRVSTLPDLTPRALDTIHWNQVQVFVSFSRTWQPRWSLMQIAPIRSLWQRHYGSLPATRNQIRADSPFRRVARFERRGQWVDIFAAPALEGPSDHPLLAHHSGERSAGTNRE